GRGAQCSRSLTWLARSVDEFLGSRPSLNGSGSELSITSASGSASALGVWSLRRGELGKTTDNSRRSDHNLGSRDRKSTRLNSSHVSISYAVFCLKKKKKNNDKI